MGALVPSAHRPDFLHLQVWQANSNCFPVTSAYFRNLILDALSLPSYFHSQQILVVFGG
jgi:hypothetical protein